MPPFRAWLTVIALFLLPVLAGPAETAQASAGPWIDLEQSRLRLVAAEEAVGEGDSLQFGLQFQLQPGWKIYWRSPGEAGYPPTVDWSGSENFAEARIDWPVPHRFTLFGLETFGYSTEVVLPITVRPKTPGEPLALRAHVTYLICEKICIPREAALSLDLAAGPAVLSGYAALIDGYRDLVPGDGKSAGLSIEWTVLTGSLEAPVLEVTARSQKPFRSPDLLVEGPRSFFFEKPEVSLSDGGRAAILRLATRTAEGAQSVLEGKRLTLTLIDGRRGMEREIVARFPGGVGAVTTGRALAIILGLALLGGVILNLMPCVLPVLSIKLLSVVKQGGRDRRDVRASFLASAAGIVVSFLALAAAAVALKSLGLTVGWGIQFQQPLFLAVMALVVTLFACNLFGIFEIVLPARLQAIVGGTGQGSGGHSLAGHFMTGAFATLLATPCSAPFLGTALGFALARGAQEIFLIFTVLGLGLALPYLTVAAAPSLATRLPKPGAWMVTLRRILGLALAATALWLLSVLAVQVGLLAAVLTGALLAGLGLVLWLGRAASRQRILVPALAAGLAVAAIGLPAGVGSQGAGATAAARGAAQEDAEAWAPLDTLQISRSIAENKVVFVDVTADWCITCKVNKTLVLDDDVVGELLAADGVVRMRGDWTLPNQNISGYLESFGRYGIPFNAVYGPGAPEGILLPELLSVDAVTEALARAAGG
jgi:suppressor for copper-sensitivity B